MNTEQRVKSQESRAAAAMRRLSARDSRLSAAQSNGFTIIELLVYIILVGMFSTIVIKAMLDYWSGAATLVNDNKTLVSREDAGDSLRTYLNPAARLVDQN